MAQSVSNTVTSTNPLAGLLGLNPKPKASVDTTTPQSLVGAPQTNFQSLLGGVTHGINSAIQSIPSALGSVASTELNGIGNAASGVYNYLKAPSGTPYSTPNPAPQAQTGLVSPTVPAIQSQAPVIPQVTNSQPNAVSTPLTTPSGMQVTGNPGTFSGTNSTAPTATTPGVFSNVLGSLANSGAANNALGQNAQNIAANYGQQIANVGGQGAKFQAGQLTTGTTPVAEGNAAVTAQTTAAQQAALAAGEQAALTGNQQAISAQGQTQSALATAAGLAQPSQAAFGQTVFDPATGQYTGGGGLPADVMQQYAQMAVNGNYSAIPSSVTSNPVLNAQLNVAAQALNPSFSPVQAQGASGVIGGLAQLTSANTAADGIKNTITSYLSSNPQLNPAGFTAGNQLSQWLAGKQLGDPKYQTLANYLNEYTNTLAPILGVGGDATNLKTQIAQGFVNAAASGQSISSVLESMSQLATNKIQDIQNGATGGSTSVPSSTNGSGGWASLGD